MRNKFDEQLEQLNSELIEMGNLCETAIMEATNALLEGNRENAKLAIANDEEIDQKEGTIETLCLKMLLRQQPVAKDLRTISSAMKMITDMERIGDQAADIASITMTIDFGDFDRRIHIAKMASATIKMVSDSVQAFVHNDLSLARKVMEYDAVVDELFMTIKKELIKIIKTDGNDGEKAIDILMVSKYYERIGDHATNIAEWVEFSITGQHKGATPI